MPRIDTLRESGRDSNDGHLHFRPLLMFAGIFIAGFSLLYDHQSPVRAFVEGSGDAMPFACLFAGMLLCALILTLVLGRREFTRGMETGIYLVCLALMLIGDALLCGLTLSVGQTATSSDGAARLMTGCCFFALGAGASAGVSLWVRAFRAASMQSVLFNGSLVFLVSAVATFLGEKIAGPAALLVCAGYLLLGACTSLAALHAEPFPGTSDDPMAHPDHQESLLSRLFLSIPLLGYLISMYTTGASALGTGDTASPSSAPVALVIALIVLGFSMSPLARKNQRLLGYAAYGIVVPAVAVVGLTIKMIPVESISSQLFRDFMFCYFQLLALAAWTFAINVIRDSGKSVVSVCGPMLVGISAAALLGLGTGYLDQTPRLVIMGILTGAFLLYSVAVLTRNVVLYSKGAESGRELSDAVAQPLDVDIACRTVSERYHLSTRESEVLVELAYGHASSYIAKVLYVSENTARTHMKNIYHKLGINSRDELLEIIRSVQKGA